MTAVSLDAALAALRTSTDLLDEILHAAFDSSKPHEAVAIAESAEAKQIAHNRQLLTAPQRLSLLARIEQEAPTLLLTSFHKTHADVLRFDALTQDDAAGIRTAVGDFTHTPSGLRYVVVVAPVPEGA